MESARELTGARLGGITTIDKQGEIQDFVTGGIPAEEPRRMMEWPDAMPPFEHLRDLRRRCGRRTCPATSARSAFPRLSGARRRCRGRPPSS